MSQHFSPSSLASIAVIYTGGTIGMMPTEKGLAPAGQMGERLQRALASLPLERQQALPSFELISLEPLIDSSNAQPNNWFQLAQLLWQLKDQYQGFVLLHGTDTLAYTASALSYLTLGFVKPIVVTGAQYPLEATDSDALNNVEGALLTAQQPDIQEVVVAFGGRVLRGNRCSKVSTYSPQAFASPNVDALGRWQDGVLEIQMTSLLSVSQSVPECFTVCFDEDFHYRDSQVAVVKLYPGLATTQLSMLLAAPIQAVVLETFGSGNAPDQNQALMQMLQEADAAGIVIVNRSQCAEGAVSMSYATGSALTACGVISAHDMTLEAALTKLHLLLQKPLSPSEIKSEFSRIYCAEFNVS